MEAHKSGAEVNLHALRTLQGSGTLTLKLIPNTSWTDCETASTKSEIILVCARPTS